MRGGIVLFVNSFSVYSKIRIIRKGPYLFPGRSRDIDKMILLLLSFLFSKKFFFLKMMIYFRYFGITNSTIPNRTLTLQ